MRLTTFLILIIVKVTITVFRNKNRDSSEEKPKPEDEVYSNVIHEISSNDQMQDTELSDEDLKIMLEHKFLNGKMSPETYNYMKDFIESSNRKL